MRPGCKQSERGSLCLGVGLTPSLCSAAGSRRSAWLVGDLTALSGACFDRRRQQGVLREERITSAFALRCRGALHRTVAVVVQQPETAADCSLPPRDGVHGVSELGSAHGRVSAATEHIHCLTPDTVLHRRRAAAARRPQPAWRGCAAPRGGPQRCRCVAYGLSELPGRSSSLSPRTLGSCGSHCGSSTAQLVVSHRKPVAHFCPCRPGPRARALTQTRASISAEPSLLSRCVLRPTAALCECTAPSPALL